MRQSVYQLNIEAFRGVKTFEFGSLQYQTKGMRPNQLSIWGKG